MFISDESFEERIRHEENILAEDAAIDALVNGVILNRTEKKEGAGRAKGDLNIPPIFRELIAIQAHVGGGTQKEIAQSYGISESRVAMLKGGQVTGKRQTLSSATLQIALEDSLGKVRDRALDRITKALGCMDDESLEDTSAKELSAIVANLSRVVTATMPKNNDSNSTVNNFQTVFFAPESKQIDSYPVVEA